jgi:signal transduction histidine kinase/CheY-like chemotaxis protein
MLARDIAHPVAPVRPDELTANVVARFESNPELEIIPVVDDGSVSKLLTREGMLLLFAHRFGRDLWARRPVSAIVSPEPRVFLADASLEQIGRLIASVSADALREGVAFVETDGSYVGVASGFDLYRVAVRLGEHKNVELSTLAQQLKEETGRAQIASQAKSDFLATMSHEIRTPLNGMLGMSQALGLSDLSGEQRGMLETIIQSGETLTSLLNDILDLSKIESGRLDIAPVDSSLDAMVERVRRLYAGTAAEKQIQLTAQRTGGENDILGFDPVRVHQCLANLVSNAVKFTQTGGVSVTYSTRRSGAGAIDVRLDIRDTGIGIDLPTIERLFQPFTQADASITRRFGGSGLGLAISRHLARLMGGDVTASSTPCEGSVFTFTFRASPASAEAASTTQEAGHAEATLSLSRPLRILVVDDNAVNRQVVRLFLASMPARTEIVEAENGLEALQRLDEQTFDLALLDVHMPVMDGRETIQRIRASDAPWRSLPVIALTADAMAGEREKLLALGMTDFVAKPVDRRVLLGRISACVWDRPGVVPPSSAATATMADGLELDDIFAAIEAA